MVRGLLEIFVKEIKHLIKTNKNNDDNNVL